MQKKIAQTKLKRVNARRRAKGRPSLPDGYYEGKTMYPVERLAVAPVSVNPVISHSSQRTNKITISHSELIEQVYGSANYGTQTYAFNPGNASTFPWLAQVADIWDMYEFNSLRIRYEPATSTTATGAVFMGFDYDVLDSAPLAKGAFMMMGEACSAPPWTQCSITLPSSKLHARGPLFCSGSGVPTNADKKTYHLGNLFIGTQGQAGNTYIGDLYVDYNVTFTMPQQNRSPVTSAITNSVGCTAAHPFGTVYNSLTNVNPDACQSPPGTMFYNGTSSYYIFSRSGYYIVVVEYSGTGLSQAGGDLSLNSTSGIFSTDSITSYSYVTSGTYSCYAAFVDVTEGNYMKIIANGATTMTVANFLCAIIDPNAVGL